MDLCILKNIINSMKGNPVNLIRPISHTKEANQFFLTIDLKILNKIEQISNFLS